MVCAGLLLMNSFSYFMSLSHFHFWKIFLQGIEFEIDNFSLSFSLHCFRCILFGSWALEHRLNSCGTWLVALQHVGSSWIRDQTHVSCIGRQIIPEGPGKPSDAFLPLFLCTEYILKKSVLRFFITDFMQFDYDVPWCSFFFLFFFFLQFVELFWFLGL